MAKINKLANIVATAARIEKKANEYTLHNARVHFDGLLSTVKDLHSERTRKDSSDYKYLDLYEKLEGLLKEYPELKLR